MNRQVALIVGITLCGNIAFPSHAFHASTSFTKLGGWKIRSISSPWISSSRNMADVDDESRPLEGNGGETNDVAQGGSRFKDLMEEAQKRKQDGDYPATLENPFAKDPYAGIDIAPSEGDNTPDPSAGMTVEQQAEMFRAMMQKMQPAAAAQEDKPDPANKPVGRNRDADSIQNTSDLYFAQLKRDSTVRTIARERGDQEAAEAVFNDEGINLLEDMMYENPYLKEQRDKEREIFDSNQAEVIAFQEALSRKEGSVAGSGISYKQKLEEKRKKIGLQPKEERKIEAISFEPPVTAKEEQSTAPAPSIPADVETTVEEVPAAVLALQQKPIPTPPPIESITTEKATEDVPSQPSPTPPAAVVIASSPFSSNPEEMRQSLRTLQGLLLKHRGGPGFGSGGLKGVEITRFETLVGDVTAVLKGEAMTSVAQTTTSQEPSSPSVPLPPPSRAAPERIAATTATPPISLTQDVPISGGIAVIPTAPSNEAQVESLLQCIEGAIKMYRNCPPELKEGILVTLRAALLSAVNTCSKAIGENERNTVEMYNQPMGGYDAFTAPTDIPPPPVTNQQFLDVEKVVETPPSLTSIPVYSNLEESLNTGSMDANSQVLENFYKQLENASGDGRMGLRSDLTPADAGELSDSISEMRSILVDELENGIPSQGSSVPETPRVTEPTTPTTTGTSRYQQMLAKARASKGQ